MPNTRSCPNCGLLNPGEARVCDCGFDFALGGIPVVVRPVRHEDTAPFDTFLRDHAGKLWWIGILVSLPFHAISLASGEPGASVVGLFIKVSCIGLSVAGYRLRNRN